MKYERRKKCDLYVNECDKLNSLLNEIIVKNYPEGIKSKIMITVFTNILFNILNASGQNKKENIMFLTELYELYNYSHGN